MTRLFHRIKPGMTYPVHKAESGKGFFPDQYLSMITYRVIDPRDHAPGAQEAYPYFEYHGDAERWLKRKGARMPGVSLPRTHREAVSIWTRNLDDDTPVYVYNALGGDEDSWLLADRIDMARYDPEENKLDIFLTDGGYILNAVSGVVYVNSKEKINA